MNEPTGAPGPASVPPPDPDAVRSDRTAGDTRGIDLEAERNGATPPAAPSVPPGRPEFWEYENPAASVLVTEVQELSRKVDMIGTAAIAGIWLLGMLVGGVVYTVTRNRPAIEAALDEPVEVDSADE